MYSREKTWARLTAHKAVQGGMPPEPWNLAGVDLGQADLNETNFIGVDLSGANLSGANLGEAHMKGTILKGANLQDANLKGVFKLNVKQLAEVETLSNAQLSPRLMKQLKDNPKALQKK
jgi:uncharacterized protein YjbI with pentapeptide repeats